MLTPQFVLIDGLIAGFQIRNLLAEKGLVALTLLQLEDLCFELCNEQVLLVALCLQLVVEHCVVSSHHSRFSNKFIKP